MRKFLVAAAFAVTMALGAVVSPVAAGHDEPSNCVGAFFGAVAPVAGRSVGGFVSFVAQNQSLGVLGEQASSNCGSLACTLVQEHHTPTARKRQAQVPPPVEVPVCPGIAARPSAMLVHERVTRSVVHDRGDTAERNL